MKRFAHFRFACFCCAALLAWIPLPQARGDGPAEGKMVSAATADAIVHLRQTVLRELIGREMTVADLIVKTDSTDRLTRVLEHAEPVGGPRWVSPDVCQVQVEISGATLAELLEQIAADKPEQSPVPASELNRLAADWSNRNFSASGSSGPVPMSTSPSALNAVAPEPHVPVAWVGVSSEARDRAIAAARQTAIDRIEQAMAGVDLNQHQKIADALAIPVIRKAVDDWLASRPIERVQLRDDLRAEVTLNVNPDAMFEFLRTLLEGRADVTMPAVGDALNHVHDQFISQMPEPMGRATVAAAEVPRMVAGAEVPRHAPRWIAERMKAEGTAVGRGSRLFIARVAEAEARRRLRGGIEALELDGKVSIGAAAIRDARIRAAIDRAVADGSLSKTTYNADGSVTVQMVLDLKDLWDELRHP